MIRRRIDRNPDAEPRGGCLFLLLGAAALLVFVLYVLLQVF